MRDELTCAKFRVVVTGSRWLFSRLDGDHYGWHRIQVDGNQRLRGRRTCRPLGAHEKQQHVEFARGAHVGNEGVVRKLGSAVVKVESTLSRMGQLHLGRQPPGIACPTIARVMGITFGYERAAARFVRMSLPPESNQVAIERATREGGNSYTQKGTQVISCAPSCSFISKVVCLWTY